MDMKTYVKALEASDELISKLNSDVLNWKYMAAIAIVFEDSVHVSPNQACHAGLRNSYPGNKESGALAVVSALMDAKPDGQLTEKEAITYLHWLLNESPYASTFITKDVYDCLLNKRTISDAFTPAHIMAGGMVASRRLWEYPVVARIFCDLAEKGVNKNLAYILGHMITCSFDRKGVATISEIRGGHCTLDANSIGKGVVYNFVNNKVVNPKETYNQNWDYYGYSKAFGAGNSGLYNFLSDNLKELKGNGKAAYANPFAKAVVEKAPELSYAQIIEALVELEKPTLQWAGVK